MIIWGWNQFIYSVFMIVHLCLKDFININEYED